MAYATKDFDQTQIPLILDKIPVGITVIDLEGHILYYNDCCAERLNRKPEWLGRDIRLCHQKQESNDRIDQMLETFKNGRKEPNTFQNSTLKLQNSILSPITPINLHKPT